MMGCTKNSVCVVCPVEYTGVLITLYYTAMTFIIVLNYVLQFVEGLGCEVIPVSYNWVRVIIFIEQSIIILYFHLLPPVITLQYLELVTLTD